MKVGEEQVIRNVIERLKKRHCGCLNTIFNASVVKAVKLAETTQGSETIEVVARIYLDTWVIPALELLLEEGQENIGLALRLSR